MTSVILTGTFMGVTRTTGINWNCTGYLGCRVTLDLGLSLNLHQTNYVAGNKVSPFLRLNFFIGHMNWLHFFSLTEHQLPEGLTGEIEE